MSRLIEPRYSVWLSAIRKHCSGELCSPFWEFGDHRSPLQKMDDKNKLYFGDNLKILREYVPDATVDLIYLDPPFNSSATYNVLFKEKSGEESAPTGGSPLDTPPSRE